jgi:hypothetical protein
LTYSKEEYCAYSHFSDILRRNGENWDIAVYETYLDDSGTDSQSPLAIAACYVSTKRGWDNFVKEWDVARYEEGFDYFHMAEFVSPREHGHRPWCDWDNQRKDRVYNRLAEIVNTNKRMGIGVALPKELYDGIPERIRFLYGSEHYTFAIRMCLMQIYLWRKENLISLPMQYIFDYEDSGTQKRIEIEKLMSTVHDDLKPLFGLDGGGYSFQSKKRFKPLQAADILAWQMHNYIPKIYPKDETQEDVNLRLHKGFAKLRVGQEMRLGCYSQSSLNAWLEKTLAFEKEHGVIR